MPRARFLHRVLDLRPGEGKRVALLYLLMFVGAAGTAWARNVIDAEFLHHVGVEYLPWLFAASALGSATAIAVYGAFADRVRNDLVNAGINIAAAIGIAIGAAFAASGVSAPAYALLAFVMAVSVDLSNIHWATSVNAFYDTQSAKRIFPIVTSAARTANIAAGLTTPILTSALSSPSIVSVRIFTLLIAAALMSALPFLAPLPASASAIAPRTNAAHRSYSENIAEGIKHVRGSNYLRLMAGSTLLITVLLSLSAYRSSAVLLEELRTPKAIADFLGMLNAGTNAIMLPFFLVWLGRINRRFGVGNVAMIYPAANAIFSSAIAFIPSVATAALEYFGRTTFRLTFQYTSDGLLFNAVPLHVRGRARAFIIGLLVPAGALIGAGLLLALAKLDAVANVSIAALIISLSTAYALSMWRVRAEYTRALVAMLEAQDYSSLLAMPAGDLSGTDRQTIELLRLRFESNRDPKMSALLAELWARAAGIEALEPLVRAARDAKDPKERAGIIEALFATDVGGAKLARLLAPFADDEDAGVRRAAFGGLARVSAADDETFRAIAQRRLEDEDPAVRARAVAVLLESGVNDRAREDACRVLKEMLARTEHESDDVRADTFRDLEPIAGGLDEAAQERVRAGFTDRDPRVRRAAAAIASAIDPHTFEAELVALLADPSIAARDAAIDALAKVSALPRIDPAAELATIRELRARRTALRPRCRESAAVRALSGLVEERETRVWDRLFLPLRAKHGAASAATIRRSLASGDARTRADALDVIEPIYAARAAELAELANRISSANSATRAAPLDSGAVLRALAEDSSADVRAIAEIALGGPPPKEEGKMLSTIERMVALKGVRLFESLTLDQLRAMAGLAEERSFEAGRRIIEEGAPGDSLFVIVRGRVAIEQTREDRAAKLRSIDAPACVGEMSLFDGRARSASVIAEQDTVLLELGREPVLALARRHPDLSIMIIEELSDRLRAANERIFALDPISSSAQGTT